MSLLDTLIPVRPSSLNSMVASLFPTVLTSSTSPSSFLHLNPPHRAEHVGSLLRPASLLERRSQYEAKLCTIEELREAEDAAIQDAVTLQQKLGLCTITDGEMRRYDVVIR